MQVFTWNILKSLAAETKTGGHYILMFAIVITPHLNLLCMGVITALLQILATFHFLGGFATTITPQRME
jgi:hypothetical protein